MPNKPKLVDCPRCERAGRLHTRATLSDLECVLCSGIHKVRSELAAAYMLRFSHKPHYGEVTSFLREFNSVCANEIDDK